MRSIFHGVVLCATFVMLFAMLPGCSDNSAGVTTVQMGGGQQGNPLSISGIVTTLAGQAPQLGTADGNGTAARFNAPAGITTDGTFLYVADTGNNTIRKVDIATGAVTTLAGTVGVGTVETSGSTDGVGSAAKFNAPFAITTDGRNLYVADTNNNTIRSIVIATGAVTTLAGSAGATGSTDGIGSAARFNSPGGITTDSTNLYVSDTGNRIIRKVVIATGTVTTLAGSPGTIGSTDGIGAAALFGTLFGITTDGTNVFVADADQNTIRRVVITTGAVTTLAGSAGETGIVDGTGSVARFNSPIGLTTDGTNLYVADSRSNSIRKVAIATGVVTTTIPGSTATTNSPLTFPLGITSDGTTLFVADTDNSTIDVIK